MLRLILSYFQQHIIARLIAYIVIAVVILNLAKIGEIVCGISYTNWGILAIYVILVIANERGLFDNKMSKTIEQIVDDEPLTSLIDDQPTIKDKLERQQYVSMLGRKIVSTYVANTSKRKNVESKEDYIGSAFAINIEEDYGYGKTSFLMMVKGWFEEHHSNQYIWIDFKPWLCDNTSSLISEFFHQLAEEISIDIDLRDDIIRYGKALASQAIKYAIGIQAPSLFHSHESSLKKQHDDIREKLNKKPQLIIVTIDDLDRLDKEEVMAVLKLMRDTADFPNIFYVSATEHTYLYNVLQLSGIEDPDRYIEKFFNLHFYLPAHEVNYKMIVGKYLLDFAKAEKFSDDRLKELYRLNKVSFLNTCFNDIRDAKRFVNQAVLSIESFKSSDYNLYDAFLISLLQYKCPELYKILRDDDDDILEVASIGNDTILQLKYNPATERHNRDFYIKTGKKDPNMDKKILPIWEYLKKDRPFRNSDLGEEILNLLFDHRDNRSDTAVNRTNRFFLYFSGKDKQSSITKSEVISIMHLEDTLYKKALANIFQEGKNYAFRNEINHVLGKDWNDKIDALKKIFIYFDFDYEHADKSIKHDKFNYVYRTHIREFGDFVYNIIGHSDSEIVPEATEEEKVKFESFISEYDIVYSICLVYVISNALREYSFDREVIDNWRTLLFNRFISETFKNSNSLPSRERLAIAYFYREEYVLQAKWDDDFYKYISNKEVLKIWLSHILIKYPSCYDWNYYVREAMFGRSFDSRAQKLIESLIVKFTDISSELQDLKGLLHTKEIIRLDLSDNSFVKKFVK